MNARTLLEGVPVSCLSFSPDSRIIAVGSSYGPIRIRDTNTMKPLSYGVAGILSGHTDSVTGICFDPSYADRGYQYALSCSLDKTVRTWDVKNSAKVYFPMEHPAGVRGMAISADGSYLACILVTDLLYVWTLRPGRQPCPKVIKLIAPATAVAFSQQDHALATGDADGSVYILDLDSQWQRHILPPLPSIPKYMPIRIDVMIFTADDQELMCSSTGSRVRMITIPSNDPQPPFLCAKPSIDELLTPASEHNSTKAVSVDEHGVVKVLTTTPTGEAGVWTVGRRKALPLIHTGIVGVGAISRDGNFMLTARSDGALILWDIPPM